MIIISALAAVAIKRRKKLKSKERLEEKSIEIKVGTESMQSVGNDHYTAVNLVPVVGNLLSVKIGDVIGQGHFGSVHRGTFDGKSVAVKKILDVNAGKSVKGEAQLLK